MAIEVHVAPRRVLVRPKKKGRQLVPAHGPINSEG